MENVRFVIRSINDEDGLTDSVIDELRKHYLVEKGIVYEWHEKKDFSMPRRY